MQMSCKRKVDFLGRKGDVSLFAHPMAPAAKAENKSISWMKPMYENVFTFLVNVPMMILINYGHIT